MNTQEIVETLNRIEADAANPPGQNSAEIWDYVQQLDTWDAAATDTVDPNWAGCKIALTNGEIITWDDHRKVWTS